MIIIKALLPVLFLSTSQARSVSGEQTTPGIWRQPAGEYVDTGAIAGSCVNRIRDRCSYRRTLTCRPILSPRQLEYQACSLPWNVFEIVAPHCNRIRRRRED